MSFQTIWAGHIEEPMKEFFVNFMRSSYFNVFWHPAERRKLRVLAETEEGAMKIAKYHFYTGSDFRSEK